MIVLRAKIREGKNPLFLVGSWEWDVPALESLCGQIGSEKQLAIYD